MGEVITVEREIQKCLEQERAKAGDWLDKVKKECAQESLKEESRITGTLAEAEVKAGKEAEAGAAAFMQEAAQAVDRLEQLDNNAVQGCIEKYIRRILPG